jgi:hypothetical protein
MRMIKLVSLAFGALSLLLVGGASAAPCAGPVSVCHCHDGSLVRFKCKATPPANGLGVITWPGNTDGSGVSGTGSAAYIFTSAWQTDGAGAGATYTVSGPYCDTAQTAWNSSNSGHCAVCP